VRLARAAAGRGQLPAETRREFVETERVNEIFAAEVSKGGGGHDFEAVILTENRAFIVERTAAAR
jgi:hypothetical protein